MIQFFSGRLTYSTHFKVSTFQTMLFLVLNRGENCMEFSIFLEKKTSRKKKIMKLLMYKIDMISIVC